MENKMNQYLRLDDENVLKDNPDLWDQHFV